MFPLAVIWSEINQKMGEYILQRSRKETDDHGVSQDFLGFITGAMRQRQEKMRMDGMLRRSIMAFDAAETTDLEITNFWVERLLGNRNENEDVTEAERLPLGMALNAIKDVVSVYHVLDDKKAQVDRARDAKRSAEVERQLWETIDREEKIGAKRKRKSIGGKAPRKSSERRLQDASINYAQGVVAVASINPDASTSNAPVGERSTGDAKEDPMLKEEESSGGASSA